MTEIQYKTHALNFLTSSLQKFKRFDLINVYALALKYVQHKNNNFENPTQSNANYIIKILVENDFIEFASDDNTSLNYMLTGKGVEFIDKFKKINNDMLF